jgi:hypothetical protein
MAHDATKIIEMNGFGLRAPVEAIRRNQGDEVVGAFDGFADLLVDRSDERVFIHSALAPQAARGHDAMLIQGRLEERIGWMADGMQLFTHVTEL